MDEVKTINTDTKEIEFNPDLTSIDSSSSETKNIRVAIPKPQRSEIIKSQSYRCGICDSRILGGNFHVDHLVPVCIGGTNNNINLLAMCPNCHGLKSCMVDRNLRFLGVNSLTTVKARVDLIDYVKASLKYATQVSEDLSRS